MQGNIWIKKQNEILNGDSMKNIKPKRRYPHFDNKIYSLTSDLASKIFDPNFIIRHAFFPFIQYEKIVRKRNKGKKLTGYRIDNDQKLLIIK